MRGFLRVILPLALIIGLVNAQETRKRYTTKTMQNRAPTTKMQTQSTKEDAGAFIGLGIGYGGIVGDFKLSGINNGTFGSEPVKFNGGGVALDVLVGYKHFFVKYVGLRYYANVDFITASIKAKDSKMEIMQVGLFNDARRVNLINYDINIDLLINFISNESVDFGAYVGVGVGGNTWNGKGMDTFQQEADKGVQTVATAGGGSAAYKINVRKNKIDLDVALNVGLRINIAKHHGIELAARVPFIKSTIAEKSHMKNTADTDDLNVKMTLHNPYRIMARYAYNF